MNSESLNHAAGLGPLVGLIGLGLLSNFTTAQEAAIPCSEALEPVGLCYGDHTVCAIDFVGDVDVFRFSGKAGDLVTLTINGTSVCVDPQIDVRDPFNTQILTANCMTNCGNICAFSETFMLPMDGGYTIIVDDAGSTEVGNYVIDLQRTLPETPEPFLENGILKTVEIGHQGDRDYLRFVAEAGSEVRFVVSGASVCVDPVFEIYDLGGALLSSDSCDTNCGNICTFQVNVGGPNGVFQFPGQVGSAGQTGEVREYYARVYDNGLTELGNITVTMNCLFSPSFTCPPPLPAIGPLGTSYCQANPNSTGKAAELSAIGSTDIADSDLHLLVNNAPPNKKAFFLFGPNQGFTPFFAGSQGNLCLASPLGRTPSEICGLGTGHLSIDVPNLPQGFQIPPGSTWNFQVWFRDNNPGATSNTSDGLTVTFQ